MSDFAGETQMDPHMRDPQDAQALVARAVNSGLPVVVMDRQGELCDAIVRDILRDAPERAGGVVMVDFDDQEWPVAFNPLDVAAPGEIPSTVRTFRTLLSQRTPLRDDSAPRALHLAAEATAALAGANVALAGSAFRMTPLDIPGVMQRTDLRRDVMAATAQTMPAFEGLGAYDRTSDRQRADVAMPLLRAFSPVGNSRHLANLLGTERTKLDFAELAAEGRIVLVCATAQVADPAGFGAFIAPHVDAAIGSATAGWDRTDLTATSGPAGADPHGATVMVASPTLVGRVGAGTTDVTATASGTQDAATLEKIRTRSRAMVCNPRDEVEARRHRRLDSLREALAAVGAAGGPAATSAA